MEARSEVSSVFERLDPRSHEVAGRIPADIKGLVDAALRGGEGAVTNFGLRVSTLNIVEQNSVFEFLSILDGEADEEYRGLYVSSAVNPGSEIIEAVKKCIVIAKLLKAIASCMEMGMRIPFLDGRVRIYQELLAGYEAIVVERTSVSDGASAVLGGLAK